MSKREITVNIPFVYILDEPAPYSERILKTIKDCEAEVRLELSHHDPSQLFMYSTEKIIEQ